MVLMLAPLLSIAGTVNLEKMFLLVIFKESEYRIPVEEWFGIQF